MSYFIQSCDERIIAQQQVVVPAGERSTPAAMSGGGSAQDETTKEGTRDQKQGPRRVTTPVRSYCILPCTPVVVGDGRQGNPRESRHYCSRPIGGGAEPSLLRDVMYMGFWKEARTWFAYDTMTRLKINGTKMILGQ